jgi:putative ABC transport system permease protein
MFLNYLKITLRNLASEKLYALINVFGLTLGLSCCLVLGLYVFGQLSYDRHWENQENLYRIVNDYTFSGSGNMMAWTPQSVGQLLLMDYPDDVESYTRFRPPNGAQATVFRRENIVFYWQDVYLADPNVFELFDHNVVYGNPDGALDDSLSVAISSFASS